MNGIIHKLRLGRLALTAALVGSGAVANAQEPPPAGLQELAQQSVEQLLQAGNNTLLAAMGQARQIMSGLQEWNAQALDDLNALANQAGVALDFLVPSVQGCIRDQDGEPLVGTPVLGLSTDFQAQMFATTAGNAVPATFSSAPPAAIPVNTAWLSPRQSADWGPGCYWMPVPPGLISDGVGALVSLAKQQPSGLSLMVVVPVIPGYELEPASKTVVITGETYRIDSNEFLIFGDAGQEFGLAD